MRANLWRPKWWVLLAIFALGIAPLGARPSVAVAQEPDADTYDYDYDFDDDELYDDEYVYDNDYVFDDDYTDVMAARAGGWSSASCAPSSAGRRACS